MNWVDFFLYYFNFDFNLELILKILLNVKCDDIIVNCNF